MITLFVYQVSYEFEKRTKDEYGWLPGHEPGNGHYESRTETYRIIAPSEKIAEVMTRSYYEGSGLRNTEVKLIEKISIDKIVRIEQ